ncbi:CPBP family intramembrane metalloprotease [Tenacibaculum sp. Bg11-29]|uniref:CPBP family intramembrane glutamic endopeptidase n=1 Tax=Tenacibaculum sp. Bg11-29 TaxID=2058306 RepID=UPI000C33D739|nr:CPBP family intramembrane glutamic endopeptidase [Tenacibaculum sp. Bg11-29]PKH49469.1 CPBP family intramembrane metalloprotease [Tenacibaculum sp. Bg11-29]
MKNIYILKQIILFTFFITILLITNNFVKDYLLSNNITSYNTYLFTRIISNLLLATVSFIVAKKLNLFKLGGLTKIEPKKPWLIIFPLVFLVLLNGLFLDSIPSYSISNLLMLAIYCISIGISEELSLRSVLLPLFSKYFGDNKKAQIKAVFIAALLFGLLHLIKFDKGIYGEISQVFFASFIGVMFGAILLVIKRIYPLIIIHAVIDFVAKLDSIGKPIKEVITNPMDLGSAVLSILLTFPCLIYGIYVLKKRLN